MSSSDEISSHYRSTTLGSTLQSSLNELQEVLRQAGAHASISDQNFIALKKKVMEEFDRQINTKIQELAKNRLSISGDLVTYRHCDNVWQMVLENVRMSSGNGDHLEAEKIKLIACESKKGSLMKK